MEPVKEEEEVYTWREVNLPALSPTAAAEPELERETGERRRGRDILIAVDHGPNSKHAFDWALIHLCRLADTIHLVHAVSSMFKFYTPPRPLLLSYIQSCCKRIHTNALFLLSCLFLNEMCTREQWWRRRIKNNFEKFEGYKWKVK